MNVLCVNFLLLPLQMSRRGVLLWACALLVLFGLASMPFAARAEAESAAESEAVQVMESLYPDQPGTGEQGAGALVEESSSVVSQDELDHLAEQEMHSPPAPLDDPSGMQAFLQETEAALAEMSDEAEADADVEDELSSLVEAENESETEAEAEVDAASQSGATCNTTLESLEALHALHDPVLAETMSAEEAAQQDQELDESTAFISNMESAAMETEVQGGQKPEVFYFSPLDKIYDASGGKAWKGYPFNKIHDGAAACAGIGARLATWRELVAAWNQGAEWCACGATADNSFSYPMQHGRRGCGGRRQVVRGCGAGGANCFGIKPKQGRVPGVYPFSPKSYHAPGVRPPPNPVGEPFYFSPGVMKYDTQGGQAWKGYPFKKNSDAANACAAIGYRLATRAEVDYAFFEGADWCACGAVSDGTWPYPINKPRGGCSSYRRVERYCRAGGAVCFGRKPVQGAIPGVHPFSPSRWNAPLRKSVKHKRKNLEVFYYATTPRPWDWLGQKRGGYPWHTYAEARRACESIGARVATRKELDQAFALGAEWCACAATSSPWQWSFPMQHKRSGCGTGVGVYQGCKAGGANCYGRKPRQGSVTGVAPFTPSRYHAPGVTPPGPPDYGDNEVFYYSPRPYFYDTQAGTSWAGYPFKSLSEASQACAAVGARLATPLELEDHFHEGADWCACGATSTGMWGYPIQKPRKGCASTRSVQKYCKSGGANCFGRKPRQGTVAGVAPFAPGRWNAPGRTPRLAPKRDKQVFYYNPANVEKKYIWNGKPGKAYAFNNEHDARKACESVGAELATPEQLQEAFMEGAEWCACSMLKGGKSRYPMGHRAKGCGWRTGVIRGCSAGGAACFGFKPKEGKYPGMAPFKPGQWLAPGTKVHSPKPKPKPKPRAPKNVKPPPAPKVDKPAKKPAPVKKPPMPKDEDHSKDRAHNPNKKVLNDMADPKPIKDTEEAKKKLEKEEEKRKEAKKENQGDELKGAKNDAHDKKDEAANNAGNAGGKKTDKEAPASSSSDCSSDCSGAASELHIIIENHTGEDPWSKTPSELAAIKERATETETEDLKQKADQPPPPAKDPKDKPAPVDDGKVLAVDKKPVKA